MRIVIDVGPYGEEHFVDTDPSRTQLVSDPLRPDTQVDVLTMLTHIKDRADLQLRGGWHVVNQLPDEDKPMTRWDRMVKAVRESNDTRAKEAFGL